MRDNAGLTLIALVCAAARATAIRSAVTDSPAAERLQREGAAAALLSRFITGA